MLSSLVLVPLVVGVVWFLPAGTVVLALVILIRAFWEYADLVERTGTPLPRVVTTVAGLSTCAAFIVAPSSVPSVLMAAFVAISTVQIGRGAAQKMLGSVSAASFSLLYLALPIGALVSLRVTVGPEVALLLLVTVMVSDIAQYYGGRLFGRRSLAAVSPNKTVEGAIFGVTAGILVLWVAGHWWLTEMTPVIRFLLGAAVAGFGIAGDLFESTLKRIAGVKDASDLIPGHGGVLDRIDGLLFAAPVYYTVVHLVS